MRLFAIVVFAVIASASQAVAQTSELPRGLIGVGALGSSTDASSRMRLGEEARPWIYSGEVSARLAPRLGIGVEAIDFGIATGETRGITFHSTGKQHERAIIGLLRARVVGSHRVALDVVGGGGVLFQRHLAETATCFNGCTATSTTEFAHRAPAFVAGADVPIRVGGHLSIAAIGRYYVFRRGDNTPTDPRQPIAWQFEYESSSRLGIGASARVTW